MKKKSSPAPEEYLKICLGRADEALGALPKEARDISAVTVSLSAEAADMVRWEFRDLKKRILELAKADEWPDRIYQVNLQFFPVSK